jgi:endonuclease/exonuclease/phosphatase (EEP) superfamily protein YafD
MPRLPARAGRFARLFRLLTLILAMGYPLALLGVVLALRFVGERWWVTLVAMYLPRAGWALPLPLVIGAIMVWGDRRLLLLQVVSVAIIAFPLMGFQLGLGRSPVTPEGPLLRVVSYNVRSQRLQTPGLLAQIRLFAPDLVLLQELQSSPGKALPKDFEGWSVRHDGQFFVASRFPIRDTYLPPGISYGKRGGGGAHYVRYTIETPLGLADVFNVHTTSPREGLEEVRGNGVREEIKSGRLFAGVAADLVEFNAVRRGRQVEGLAQVAVASRRPVIIGGDTNLPGLSWLFARHLGRFRDGFATAGVGFGYTYPAARGWLRIDRILTNDTLQTVEFRVGDSVASDHHAVFALLASAR